MRFGVLVPARPAYLSMVAEWESAGYEELWFPDFQLVGADPFVTMAVAGQQTHAVHLGVAVCNPVTRHVTVVANMMATLNQLYPGRVGLGIGAGASPLSALGMRPARIADLRRFVEGCRALMENRMAEVGADGRRVGFLKVSTAALNTTDRITVRVAAGGPRSLRMAGAVADEVILGTIDPVLVRAAVAEIRLGAAEAGRDPSAIGVAVLAAAYAASDDPGFEEVVSHVGGYIPNMLISNRALALRAETGLSGELRDAFAATDMLLKGQGHSPKAVSAQYERYMETVPEAYRGLITPATVTAKVFTGGSAAFREHCALLGEIGVGTVVLFPDPVDDGAIGRIGREWITPMRGPSARDH